MTNPMIQGRYVVTINGKPYASYDDHPAYSFTRVEDVLVEGRYVKKAVQVQVPASSGRANAMDAIDHWQAPAPKGCAAMRGQSLEALEVIVR